MTSSISAPQTESVYCPDVLVVGGGPAGSTISIWLAKRSYDVVVLEKSHHPRFHIGESSLPMNITLFEQLGVSEQVASIGMLKYVAEFVSLDYEETSLFEFVDSLDKSFPCSYEVQCLKNPFRARKILKQFDNGSRYGLNLFSWIIYRMTPPAMRQMFMKPSNQFRLQIFKIAYYIMSARMLGKPYESWRRRKCSIENVAFGMIAS